MKSSKKKRLQEPQDLRANNMDNYISREINQDDFEDRIMKELKILEIVLVNVGKKQHELIMNLQAYCEKRENG